MANDKETYPVMPAAKWWALRGKFKNQVPSQIGLSYLATALSMQENSVASTILPSLKAIGIVDGEGKPTDRAYEWRDDTTYAKVCQAILSETYPEELRLAVQDPVADRASVMSWFAKRTRTGQSAAGKMTVFYQLLCEADVSKAPDVAQTGRTTSRPAAKTKAMKIVPEPSVARSGGHPNPEEAHPPVPKAALNPSLNINVQIHISADSKPDQIDQIFASMAKHLKICNTTIDD